jgi:hypothetical protein
MSEHRVPMLGAALRRRVDPARSADPKVRELVTALAGLEVAPALRPEFRAELRAQLVAVAPRLVAEGEPTPAPGEAKRPAPEAERQPRSLRLVKPLAAAACVLAVFALLLGGAVLLSRHALPGDALYGVKRASEDTQYNLTGSNVAKGKLKLQFAARRLSEVRDLVPNRPAGSSTSISAGTSDLVRDTLASADGDVQTAARLLGTAAVQHHDSAPLHAMTGWTPSQRPVLDTIIANLPAGALREDAVHTRQVLIQAQQRAQALQADLGCGCLGTAGSDGYGPKPCTGPCTASTPKQPSGHSVTPPVRHGSHPATPSQPRATTGSTPASQHQPGATRPAAPPTGTHPAGGGAGATQPPASGGAHSPAPSVPALPTLPGLGNGNGSSGGTTGAPALPITVNSCGVSASLGPIGIGIGHC